MLRWSCFAAILFLLAAGDRACPGAEGSSGPKTVAPRVTAIDGTLALGESIVVTIEGLDEWAKADGQPDRLVLVLDGRPLDGLFPDAVRLTANQLMFRLEIIPANRESWSDLLRDPVFSRPVTFTVSPTAGSPFDTVFHADQRVPLVIIHSPWGWMSLLTVAGMGALLIWMACTTNLIREPGPAPPAGLSKPYSLSLTQLAFWTYLILCSYLVLWLITGDLNTITESLLGLMGISAGTALGGNLIAGRRVSEANAKRSQLASGSQPAVVDNVMAAAPPAPIAASRGFVNDLLCDGDDHSIHRFQIIAITLVLGVIFVASVYNNLQMPEFSPTLLAMMGISAGAYLGHKLPGPAVNNEQRGSNPV